MASVGHVFVGLAAARKYSGDSASSRQRWLAAVAFAALGLLPDADVVGFLFGVAYGDAWGHRGASHSLVMAFVTALLLAVLAVRSLNDRRRVFFYTWLVITSHGLLDMCTTGGKGVALLWPFDLTRYFFPWQFIPVAPIGHHFFSARGFYVAVAELMWFAPFWLYAIWPRRKRAL